MLKIETMRQLMAAEPRRIQNHFEMTHAEYAQLVEREAQGTAEWGVAGYFLVAKSQEAVQDALKARGLAGRVIDRGLFEELGEEGIKALLWDRVDAGLDGSFTFPPKTVVLGHTDQDIPEVPVNVNMRMRDRFVDRTTREVLPLLTNVSAPSIQARNKGPQTYEIFNTTDKPLTVNVRNLVCILDVLLLDQDAENGFTQTFGAQERGVIRQGNIYNGNGQKKANAA